MFTNYKTVCANLFPSDTTGRSIWQGKNICGHTPRNKFSRKRFLSDTKDILSLKGNKGLRNIIEHDYFGVDAEEIWGIIQTEILRTP
jgi:hypothetical protein